MGPSTTTPVQESAPAYTPKRRQKNHEQRHLARSHDGAGVLSAPIHVVRPPRSTVDAPRARHRDDQQRARAAPTPVNQPQSCRIRSLRKGATGPTACNLSSRQTAIRLTSFHVTRSTASRSARSSCRMVMRILRRCRGRGALFMTTEAATIVVRHLDVRRSGSDRAAWTHDTHAATGRARAGP